MNRRQFVQSWLAAASLPLERIHRAGTLAPDGGQGAASSPDPTLWYSQPATRWLEALPIGNGRMGAMVFGDIGRDRLQINDDTLWSGGPAGWDPPGAREALTEIRQLTLAGQTIEADRLSRRLMGPYTQSYLPLGDVWLAFEHGSVVREYRRQLRLADAVASVQYRIGGVQYSRETLASAPAGIIAVRLTADRPGMLTFEVRVSSPLRHAVSVEGRQLRLRGVAPAHVDPNYYDTDVPVQYGREGGTPGGQWTSADPPKPGLGRRTLPGMRFELGLGVAAEGGEVSAGDATLRIQGASAVTLIVATATGFNGFDKDPALDGREPGPIVARQLDQGLATPWRQLRDEHVADHGRLFDRLSLDLGSGADDLPTDRRISTHGAKDAGLVALLLQYGRYLLIAGSRPGTQPANLQGIWNDEIRPPWSANYTININAQMNYWPAEPAALPELHQPLLSFIGELAVTGRRTASAYGARGWTAHHNTDLWRQSGMVGDWGHGDPVWACWQMGGAWLAHHLYEHYLFGGDVAYLRDRAYPLLRGAAEFCLDWLVEDASGRLVTAPSTSPENQFRLPSGKNGAISPGATMDLAVMRDLFADTADAAESLGVDAPFRTRLLDARARLRPYAIGSRGQLLEWVEEFAEPEPGHRHISHLVRAASRPPHQPGHAGAVCSRPAVARTARRRRHGMESRLEGQSVGTAPRRRSRVSGAERTADARGHDRHQLSRRWRRLRQPVRRASAVSNRWEFRRHRRDPRDARPEPCRRDPPAAGAAGRLAERPGPWHPAAWRLRRGSRVVGRRVDARGVALTPGRRRANQDGSRRQGQRRHVASRRGIEPEPLLSPPRPRHASHRGRRPPGAAAGAPRRAHRHRHAAQRDHRVDHLTCATTCVWHADEPQPASCQPARAPGRLNRGEPRGLRATAAEGRRRKSSLVLT